MNPPPPTSTLFPYTTLFRSIMTSDNIAMIVPNSKFIDSPVTNWHKFRVDRKSTRLNSSHVAISYAVFCLKKKKQNQTTNDNQNNHHPNFLAYKLYTS